MIHVRQIKKRPIPLFVEQSQFEQFTPTPIFHWKLPTWLLKGKNMIIEEPISLEHWKTFFGGKKSRKKLIQVFRFPQKKRNWTRFLSQLLLQTFLFLSNNEIVFLFLVFVCPSKIMLSHLFETWICRYFLFLKRLFLFHSLWNISISLKTF